MGKIKLNLTNSNDQRTKYQEGIPYENRKEHDLILILEDSVSRNPYVSTLNFFPRSVQFIGCDWHRVPTLFPYSDCCTLTQT